MDLFSKIETIIKSFLVNQIGIQEPAKVHKLLKIIRFIISGGTTAIVNFILLYSFTEYAKIYYLVSVIISFILSSFLSFILHKFWTFKNKDNKKIPIQLSYHFSIAGLNLFLNTFIVYAFVEWAGLWYMFAQGLASIIIAFESFFFLGWVFRKIEVETEIKTENV